MVLRLSTNETVSALGQVQTKTHVLIVCQSSFLTQGFELRQAIRESWATDAKNLPVSVIFILVTILQNLEYCKITGKLPLL